MTIDRESWWWRRGQVALVVLVALLLAGWGAAPLQDRAWQAVRTRQSELNLPSLSGAVGQGMVLGLLGGFRTIIADFVWIRRYYHWEKSDYAQTEALIRLATTLDPSSIYFWDNGSANLGLDMPIWRIKQAGGFGPGGASPELQQTIFREQAKKALDFLDEGLALHPGNVRLLLDKAQIYTHRLQDDAGAAEQYRLAAATPGAPYFVPRIYAETLRKLGRNRAAYDYYRQLYPTLPAGNLAAAKDDVWQRLRDLEEELQLPAAERLPASAAPPAATVNNAK